MDQINKLTIAPLIFLPIFLFILLLSYVYYARQLETKVSQCQTVTSVDKSASLDIQRAIDSGGLRLDR